MNRRRTETPTNYQQPDQQSGGRDLNNPLDDTLEVVHYLSDSHIRIWYNVQTESYPQHHHEALEIIICAESHYRVRIQEKEYLLNVGDILFIPPHMLHELICDSEGIRFICILDINMLKVFHSFENMAPVFSEPFFCTEKQWPDIYQNVHSGLLEMIDIYFTETISWEPRIYSKLLAVLAQINDAYQKFHASPDVISSLTSVRSGRISAALYYIDNNFAEDITLEDVASYIGFSKYHFSRLFKKCTNYTFYDYLCHRRVQKAQALLSTSMSITNIAFQVGFNNITTFSRCFKKFNDCSPSEYRSKLSNAQN